MREGRTVTHLEVRSLVKEDPLHLQGEALAWRTQYPIVSRRPEWWTLTPASKVSRDNRSEATRQVCSGSTVGSVLAREFVLISGVISKGHG
jgi:hypothetical protein